jgi:hypothetical protein
MPKLSMKSLKGKWKITEMDQWDVEPGWFIEFDNKGNGEFHFLYVNAEIDYRQSDEDRVEFTFHGNDEMDETFGRGWVEVESTDLVGCFYFHQGDESGFKAKKMKPSKSKNKKK